MKILIESNQTYTISKLCSDQAYAIMDEVLLKYNLEESHSTQGNSSVAEIRTADEDSFVIVTIDWAEYSQSLQEIYDTNSNNSSRLRAADTQLRKWLRNSDTVQDFGDIRDLARRKELSYKLKKDLADRNINLDVSKFDKSQLEEIRLGLEKGVDISKYADAKFSSSQMEEIRLGLEAGVDISIYANPKYNWSQMYEIRSGLENGVDVSKYADPKFNSRQMYQIRLGLETGVDVSKYADPKFDSYQMYEIRLGIDDGN